MVSVSAVTGSLLVILIVNRVVCPTQVVVRLKLLLREGGSTAATWSVALAGSSLVIGTMVPLSSPDEVNSLAGMVLIKFPGVVEVTATVTVQDPGEPPLWRGTVPPFNWKDVSPGESMPLAALVMDPPQLFVTVRGGIHRFRQEKNRGNARR